MFAGHAAVALAARPRLPRQSLGLLFAAAFWIDLVWPVLLILGVERVEVQPGNTAFTPLAFVHYPWTHSLLMVAGWALLFAFAALRGSTRPPREFAWLAALVASHWVLDFVTHRPDLPLAPGGSTMVGLGLWNSVAATLLVEGGLFVFGVVTYVRSTVARDRTGVVALWSLLAVMVVVWLAGPLSPPPNADAIGFAGLLTWLFPAWAYWADRHRALKV